jgi:hypothetical protein
MLTGFSENTRFIKAMRLNERADRFGTGIALSRAVPTPMLKISTIDSPIQRRLILEGSLVEPWVSELTRYWHTAAKGLEGRKVVIDLKNVTVISQEGKKALSALMIEGAKFACGGIHNKHVLKQLRRHCCSRL